LPLYFGFFHCVRVLANVLPGDVAFPVAVDFAEMADDTEPLGGLRLLVGQAAVMRDIGCLEALPATQVWLTTGALRHRAFAWRGWR
jgi:hypothetical protein